MSPDILESDLPLVDNAFVTQKPRQRGGVEAHAVLDELVLYDTHRDVAASLNLSAKAIWEYCDGEHSLEEISEHLSEALGCSAQDLLPDIKNTITQFRKLGLLED